VIHAASAHEGASSYQKWSGFVLLIFVIAVQLNWPDQSILVLLMAPVFLAFIIVQVGAALEPETPALGMDCALQDWPFYSVLVPLYREAAVVPQLVLAMVALDYPPDRLEILLLVEADDPDTLHALANETLGSVFRVIIVPPGIPRTKPRALNCGLDVARGELITVYDAEDIPEPAQLKHAAAMFAALPADFVCLQARLVIDNGADSWLARMASIEYAALFDAIKCGLAADELPVPLGGTSNHLRRTALDMLDGWDAWNVTEDADLGFRIARAGWRVADLPSSTYEEAPVTLKAWLGQRRRWFKGWMQTLIVHARNPRASMRAGGFSNWLITMVQLVGVVGGGLLFPVFVAHFVWVAWSGWLFQRDSWAALMANSVAIATIGAGFIAMIVPSVIGMSRRRMLHLLPWLMTMPFYVVLISLSAWMAVIDLLLRPFYWEKTEHGFAKRLQFKARALRRK
jgi:glycosyltransferase XagB